MCIRDSRYVVKMRGAGHGTKALIAELIGGEIARRLGFRVPELVFLDLDSRFGITEADEEIQDLLKWSQGLNLGLHYLQGSITWDPLTHRLPGLEASLVVWLDAFITNIDRTRKNPNMLAWYGEPWLIDHGAALYFHHAWSDPQKAALSPFPYVKDHLLIRQADSLKEADRIAHERLSEADFREITALIPDDWLQWEDAAGSPEELRQAYTDFLTTRFANSNIFTDHAIQARGLLV